jgi:predicted MFS family arabinose efflux permease
MFLGAAVLIALVAARALGARLTRLASVRFRGTFLVFASLATQLIIFTRLSDLVPGRLQSGVHVVTYLLLITFLLVNIHYRALWICALGLAANTTAIVANGGRMPISLSAWTGSGRRAASITAHGFYNNNVLAGSHAQFSWLGDVFVLPRGIPLATAFSIGDLLIVFGAIAFVCRACASPGAPTLGRLREPLRLPHFRRLLIGRATSKLGDLLTMAAVVTWLFARSHSTAAVSAFLIARILAATVGGILAAPLLDRLPGFRTLSIIELARGTITLCALPFALAGLVVPAVVVVCISTLIGAATQPSAAGLVPDLLPRELVNLGNGLHGLTQAVVMVVGAAAGSFAVIRLGIGGALLLDIATFCIAALLYLRFAAKPQADPMALAGASHRELLRNLLSSRLVLGITASFTVVTAAMGLLNATLPAFFDGKLASSDVYGYAIAAIGAGAMMGELLTGFVDAESVARRSVSVAFLLSAGCVMVLSRTGTLATAYLMLLLLGLTDGTTETVRDTLFQRYLPRRLRAGTFAISSAFQNAGMVLGFALAAVLHRVIASTTALDVVAFGCVTGAALAAIALLGRPWQRTTATSRRVLDGVTPASETVSSG